MIQCSLNSYRPRIMRSHHFRSILRSCAGQSSISTAKKLHALILTTGCAAVSNSFLANALLHFYAKQGLTRYAQYLFDQIPHQRKDTADWTALLACIARDDSDTRSAFSFLKKMRESDILLDDVVMVCLLGLCSRVGDLIAGRLVHGWLVKAGLGCSIKVSNAVMNVYVKCGVMDEARGIFREMNEPNVVSWSVLLEGAVRWEGVEEGRIVFDAMPERNEVGWTIMITGYVGSGFSKEGFLLLDGMVLGLGFRLNHVTLCSILSACAQSGDVAMGRWVHVYALKAMGRQMHVMAGTALVDMYAKCGRIDMACKVFEYLPSRNVVAWNAMLGGLAMHGKGKVVLDMLPKMMEEAKPDDLTFMAVLNACSHSGLVDRGRYYFCNLVSQFGIRPKVEHYACMVDLLGRAGRLEEAEDMIKKMPMPPNEVILGSLLGSCNVHGKLELGERILQELLRMYPSNTECHVLLSNMYALAGKQDKADSIREVLKIKGLRKVPGMSSVHVDGQVHQFSAGDKSHPLTPEIYRAVDSMIRRLRSAGYIPNTSSQVFPGCDGREEVEDKEQALFLHSEKLALCFGLMSTRSGVPLYIYKNLRICQDCHSAIKIASDVYNREIVVRDRSRFHYFKHGSCSCSDYW